MRAELPVLNATYLENYYNLPVINEIYACHPCWAGHPQGKNKDEQLRYSGKKYAVPLAKWAYERYVPVHYYATTANTHKYKLNHNIQFK